MPQPHGTKQHLVCLRCTKRRPREGFRAGLCKICAKAAIRSQKKSTLVEALLLALPTARGPVYALLGLHAPALDAEPQLYQEAG